MTNILDIIREESEVIDEQKQREDAYRQKVIQTFFEYGKLKAIPAQRKKQRICLEEIAKSFEMGRTYEEKMVRQNQKQIFVDGHCLRRSSYSIGRYYFELYFLQKS